jgi:hypothetical protein
MTMGRNTNRRRGRCRDIDNRESGFGGFNSRGGGIDVMDQTLRFITSWWIGWYLDGGMSNRINLVFNIHRSSIFGSTRNTRRETFKEM